MLPNVIVDLEVVETWECGASFAWVDPVEQRVVEQIRERDGRKLERGIEIHGGCNILIRENSTIRGNTSFYKEIRLLTDCNWGKSVLSYTQASLHGASYIQI